MRLLAAAICLVLAACGTLEGSRVQPTDTELRLLAFLARDPFVVIERTERDGDGHLLVITRQGNTHQRYLLAPDDPARPELRLRRMLDECTLETAPNANPGGGPILH